jgi:hypothetical protein
VQKSYIFGKFHWVPTILAALHLREKDLLAAKSMFEKCLKLNLHSESESLCLEGLGNVSQWDAGYSMSR